MTRKPAKSSLRHANGLLRCSGIYASLRVMQSRADELLTTSQVAVILRKPVGTVNRWASEGRLAFERKLPGRTGAYLFRRADVERLARELRKAS